MIPKIRRKSRNNSKNKPGEDPELKPETDMILWSVIGSVVLALGVAVAVILAKKRGKKTAEQEQLKSEELAQQETSENNPELPVKPSSREKSNSFCSFLHKPKGECNAI